MSHPVVIAFLIMAVVGALSLASEVLKPLALAVLLAFALTPLAEFIQRRGLPRVPSVILTVLLALGALGGFGYVVTGQLATLARRLPEYQSNIEKKLKVLRPNEDSAFAKAKGVANDVAKSLDESPVEFRQANNVRIIEQPNYRERLQSAVGPYLEFLGVGSFVLILVLFMMVSREDLRDRIVSLFGHSRTSLTTRTMDEMGRRISRYLATFAMVNSGFGLVVGLGLWAIGLKYAVLWGCLAAMLRFIPYVGSAVAFALPMIFSVGSSDGWRQPLEVVALFAVVETALNSFLEPFIYGKTTGVSALGLLVAAMFWTWLWGLMGILLSTPLTVCLAVLGKSVPSLGVFATLLGEESEIEPDVRFYQRLVALDRDGAAEIIDESIKTRQRAEVYDTILVPALSRAERDAAEGYLEDSDLAFIWRVIEETVDDFEGSTEITLESKAVENAVDPHTAAKKPLLGVVATDHADAVVLKMLAQLLEPAGVTLEILSEETSPLKLAEIVMERSPSIVIVSQLPPQGLTSARYQVRRLRARFAELPIVVGRWGTSDASEATNGLTALGASQVVTSLVDARDQILSRISGTPLQHVAQEKVAPLPDPKREALVKAGTV